MERALIEHVERGEILDLARDQPVDEITMRAWDESRTIRSWVVRDIVRGRLVAEPDPHGLRLRGARIAGRVDLENITSTVAIELDNCLLEDGLDARDTRIPALILSVCRLEHPSEPPLDAERLITTVFVASEVTISGHSNLGAINLVGARIGQLVCDGATLRNDSGPALNADGLQVDRGMYLRGGFTATGTGDIGAVRLLGARIGQLECGGATLRNDSGPALTADGLQVDQGMYLRGGFTATGTGDIGAVRLLGARIGQLECDGATLRNDSGPALNADGLQVDQGMYLRGGFTATGTGETGAVRLLDAHIGELDCGNSSVRNASGTALDASGLRVDRCVYLCDGFAAIGGGDSVTVNLTGLRVGSTLVFDPERLEHITNSRARLAVDGLVYSGLPEGISADSWLELLREGTLSYAAQPYQQLAAAHRAAGHDSHARRVLMAQRRDQIGRRALAGRAERTWVRFTGLTLGYGYQPWRALIGLLVVVAAAVVLAVVLGGHGGLTQLRTPPTVVGCTVVERIGVGLDLGIPLFTTGARARCEATNTTTGQIFTSTSWALRLLAWAFATLFIAGFTSAVRKT